MGCEPIAGTSFLSKFRQKDSFFPVLNREYLALSKRAFVSALQADIKIIRECIQKSDKFPDKQGKYRELVLFSPIT